MFKSFALKAAIIGAAMITAVPASAAGMGTAGDMMVHDAWARASAGMAKAGAAFMTLTNKGNRVDKLIAVKSDVARKTELHTHIKDGDVMRMRQVTHVPVPGGATTMMKPGSYHVMFMGLNAPFKEGGKFPLTLEFENAGSVTIDVVIGGVGAMQGKAMKMDHGKTPMKMPMKKN